MLLLAVLPGVAAPAVTPESKRMPRASNLADNGQWIVITGAALAHAVTGHAAWIRVAIIVRVSARISCHWPRCLPSRRRNAP